MTTGEIVERFHGKANGRGWMAQCPNHADDRASLSIGGGQDGRTLVRCHAGCDTRDVLRAKGLELRDLQPDRPAAPTAVAEYNYRDESGALLYQVVRFAPKDFRQRRPDGAGGWAWSLSDVRRVLYRLDKLPGCETVCIVEGEKDADALWAIDIPATTNAGGAGKWRPEYTQQLVAAGVRQVIILPDNDEPGRGHAETVAASCTDAGLSVRAVRLPGVPLKGDASDYLAGHPKDDLVALLLAAPAWQVRTEPPESPAEAACSPFPESWRLLTDVELLELPDPEFLIDGILQRRGVGVIYAPSGAGKTTFVASLLTSLATGRDFFGHRVCRPGASVYVATEDPSGFKVRLRTAKVAGRLPLNESIGVFAFPEPIDLRDAASVRRFGQFLQRATWPLPLECIVVDTYAAATPGANENSSEDTTTAMVHAQQWRDSLGVSVILVHHTNAAGNRERGHSAMRGAADFMIELNPVDDVIHVECSKQRNAGPFEPFTLKLAAMEGGGCVLRLASEVIAPESLTRAQNKALAVLRETFSEKGALKSEWQRSCHDIPERTFHRACKVLEQLGLVKEINSRFRVVGQGAM